MSRSKPRHGRRRTAVALPRHWRGPVLGLGGLVLIAWVLYLDFSVRARFDGALWRVPAVVYAQPLELHPGLEYDTEAFAAYLRGVGFEAVGQAPERAGQFRHRGDRFDLINREFVYWDGVEEARTLVVRFRGGHLWSMHDAQGEPVPLARLEPVRIGNLFPNAFSDRQLINLDRVPQRLIESLLVMEDRAFYEHSGVQPSAILRALIANLRAGRTVQGGSTLTQQLVKNLLLSPERSLWRKLNEAGMALLLEWHYSKAQILEAYCNEVYLGQSGQRSINGFATGSRFYFNRPLEELGTAELALLASLVKGPSYFDPRRYPQRALDRRNLVLRELAQAGRLEATELAQELARPLGVVDVDEVRLTAYPAYLELVRQQLDQDYQKDQLEQAGLRVFTHLDLRWQQQMEAAIDTQLPRLERLTGLSEPALESAALLADRETGQVLAISGGRQHRLHGYNRALNARRPIGSLIKPFVYLAALLQPHRFTLASRLQDEPLILEQRGSPPWEPRNFDRQSHGEVAFGEALVHSYNLATARLGLELGVDRVVALLRQLGVARELPSHPAVLLGALELSPFEVAQVYQAIAAGGFPVRLQSVRAVTDSAGQPLQRYPLQIGEGVDPRAVYLLGTLLQAVAREGTASALSDLLPARSLAGKTGTSDDARDSWFAGFDPRYLAVVWVGRDDNQPTQLSGARGALPIWAQLMQSSQAQGSLLHQPGGLEEAWIDVATGLASADHCEGAATMLFIAGSVPGEATECGGRGPRGFGELIRGLFR